MNQRLQHSIYYHYIELNYNFSIYLVVKIFALNCCVLNLNVLCQSTLHIPMPICEIIFNSFGCRRSVNNIINNTYLCMFICKYIKWYVPAVSLYWKLSAAISAIKDMLHAFSTKLHNFIWSKIAFYKLIPGLRTHFFNGFEIYKNIYDPEIV